MRALVACALLILPASAAATRRVAIGYFDNTSADKELEPLRKGLADMLITDLSVIQSIQIVEREKLNKALDELKLQSTKFFDPATSAKLGKGLGAESIMTGSYLVVGDTMRIDARVIEVATGTISGAQKVEGKRDEFFGLEKELVELLTKTLDVKLEISEKSKLRKSQTESYVAFASYSHGLDAADRGDTPAAREAFQRALEADPQYKAAKAGLERVQAALAKHEQGRASGFEAKLATLDPSSESFFDDVSRLPKKHGGTHHEQEKNENLVLAYLCENGLRPWEKGYAGHDFFANDKRYYELNEDLQRISTWMFEPEVLDDAVLATEYLLKKYPDDTQSRRHLLQTVTSLEQTLERRAKGTGRKPSPRQGEAGEREGWVRDLFQRIAKKHAAALSAAERDPAATLARIKGTLAAQKKKSDAAYEAEFKKRLGALDPADEKVGFAITDLLSASRDHYEIYNDRLSPFRDQLTALEWMHDKKARPYRGTKDDPVYIELGDLLQLSLHYEKDPLSIGLLPQVNEYVLKKYPDDKFVGSQVELHLKGIAYCNQHRVECTRDWEREKNGTDYLAAEQARALFKKIGASLRR